MNFTYRGSSYEKEPSILEMKEAEIGGKYRGKNWQYRYPRHIPPLKPKLMLQYRGVSYSTRPSVAVDHYEQRVSRDKVPQKICSVPLRKPVKISLNQTTKTHLDNMRRNLERRLQIAEARGDQNLVSLLQKEYIQLALDINR